MWARPSTWLLCVTLLYAALQLVADPLHRFYEWDEAVYISEVSRFSEAVSLAAHRSRGVTFIVAPIAVLTESLPIVRGYLIIVSSSLLFLCFLPWCRIVGWAAPVGAGIFATHWLALFYGPEVIPNLYSALFAVGALALAFNLRINPGDRRVISALVLLVAATVFVRPVDGVVLAGVIGVGVGLLSGRGRRDLWIATVVGLVLGAAPWLIEAEMRFEGPLERLAEVRTIVGGGLTYNVVEYLRLMDGPLSWPDADTAISIPGTAMLFGLAALSVLGIRHSDQDMRRSLSVTLFGALVLATPYLVGSEAAAPRFMTPAIALLALSAGMGLDSVGRSYLSKPIWRIGAPLLVMTAMLFVNIQILKPIAQEQLFFRNFARLMAADLEGRASGAPCFFLSSTGYPQISLASGCRGARLSHPEQNAQWLEEAEQEGESVFVILREDEPEVNMDTDWRCNLVRGLESTGWHVCQPA